jgi:TolA-binding protein
MRVRLAIPLCVTCAIATVSADIILSATALNDALKKMQRLRQTIDGGAGPARVEALFALGVEADALTTLINDEVAAHGSQEKALIDLAMSRTREIGVAIAYSSSKKKFFYDNAAFREYLAAAPRGKSAEPAAFKLIEGDFFQSEGTDAAAITGAAERKRTFLRQYPASPGAVEVHLMLAVDYRDLYRHYDAAGDVANRDRYRDLTRRQLRLLMKTYPKAEQAEIARRMLERFEAQLRQSP